MSLFFYGMYDLIDSVNCEKMIRETALQFNFPIIINELQNEYPISELFTFSGYFHKPVIYELKSDVYDLLYNSFNGDEMLQYYRVLAYKNGFTNWDNLNFGENEQINILYESNPYPLPCVRFISSLIETAPLSKAVFAFDHNFENRFSCNTLKGNKSFVLQQVWGTICFGYQFPNIEIYYDPMCKDY